jgi:hypothetical protein
MTGTPASGTLLVAALCCTLLALAGDTSAAGFGEAQRIAELPPELAGRRAEAATPDPQGWLVVETTLPYDTVPEASFHRLSREGSYTTITVLPLPNHLGIEQSRTDLVGFDCTRDGLLQAWTSFSSWTPIGDIRESGEGLYTTDSSCYTAMRHETTLGGIVSECSVASCSLSQRGALVCFRSGRLLYPAPAPPTSSYLDPASGITWSYPGQELTGQLLTGAGDAVACVDARAGSLNETILTQSGVTSRTLGAFGEGRTVLTCASNADTSIVVYLSPLGDARCWSRQGGVEADQLLGSGSGVEIADWALSVFDSSGGLHAILCRAGRPLRMFRRSVAGQSEWLDPVTQLGLTGVNSSACSLHDPDHPQVVLACDQGVVYYEFSNGQWNPLWLAPATSNVRYENVHAGITGTDGKAVSWLQTRWVNSEWAYDGVWIRSSNDTTSTAVLGHWNDYD